MKIRLDENLSPRIADALVAFAANRPGFEVSHNKYEAPGVQDPSWIRKFADEGGDVTISGDWKILQHWPDLVAYRESGLVSFFPGFPFAKMRGYSRAAFILLWWPAMVEKFKSSQRGDTWRVPIQWTADPTKITPINDPRFKTDEQRREQGIEPVGKVHQLRPRGGSR